MLPVVGPTEFRTWKCCCSIASLRGRLHSCFISEDISSEAKGYLQVPALRYHNGWSTDLMVPSVAVHKSERVVAMALVRLRCHTDAGCGKVRPRRDIQVHLSHPFCSLISSTQPIKLGEPSSVLI
jgi:hypothetical protein